MKKEYEELEFKLFKFSSMVDVCNPDSDFVPDDSFEDDVITDGTGEW